MVHGAQESACEGSETPAAALIAERLEALAEQFHRSYLAGLPDGHGNTAPAWEDLDERDRESNRASARAVIGQLEVMGLTVCEADPPTAGSMDVATPIVTELDPEWVERLARQEHDRWMEHKWSQGWVLGGNRDGDASPPTHPDLVPWEQLSESDRDKDRRRIRCLPVILGSVGLMIVPAGRD